MLFHSPMHSIAQQIINNEDNYSKTKSHTPLQKDSKITKTEQV